MTDLSSLFTYCSQDSDGSLVLMTTSTKENLSPRLVEKIKMLLPSKN